MEIERKYLVKETEWAHLSKPTPIEIRQGYLSQNVDCTVRVRTKNNKGFVTIKGKNVGISRSEFEYEIPIDEAIEMLDLFAEKQVIKKRYEINFNKKLWEIDVFEGKLAPLILAEIELNSEDETFEIPPFIGQEVSDDPSYYNSNLVNNA
jgi:adenylate cyclase